VAISRASNSSIQGGLPKFNDIWDGTTATSAFDSLGSVLLTSTASSVSFSSIPATYTHLQLRSSILSPNGNCDIQVTFNGDGSNYSQHYFYGGGGGGATLSSGGANQPFFYLGFNAGDATYPAMSITDILDYANTTKYKTARNIGGFDRNGVGGALQITSGNWRSETAIHTVTIFPNTGNFAANSLFSLFGVK
jgi:hypothetical protein